MCLVVAVNQILFSLFDIPILGVKYTFRMTATVTNALVSIQSFSDFDVEVNSPPSGGNCNLSPLTGSTDTPFTIECDGWSDKHLPITFRFGYSDIVQAPTTTPSYSLSLPSGLQTVSATACDAYLSCSSPFQIKVNVTSAPINVAAINDQLTRLAFTGDNNALLSFASSKMQDLEAARAGRRLLVDARAVAGNIIAQV